MFKKLLNGYSCLLAVLSVTAVTAQEYQQMPILSGLNADVIANGVGPAQASTSIDIDGVSFNYVSTDYKLTSTSTALTYGVPANGLINSAVTSGLSYQLAPLSGNNSLRLATATTTTGTITFATPIPVVTLYMLGVTGSGSGTVNAIVNFTDGTNQPFSNLVVSDWFGGTNAAIQGIGRIGRFNDVLEPNSTNPRMYQITMTLLAANQPKLVQSVQITKTPSTGIEAVNIFAFSADRYVSCKSPLNITAVSTMAGGNFSWTAPTPAPASGYEYYITSSATPPTETTTPTGTVAAGTTTLSLTNLVAGQSYYFWLRTNCGGTDKGLWKMKAFTAGQISTTFTTGDISTSYDTAPTATSATTCPGTLSVTVPPGYKIASVATNYTMTAASTGQQSQQRSLLYCTTNSLGEAAVTAGPAVNSTGVATYNRSGLTFANNLTGTVNFELRAWRTTGATPVCATNLNKVTNNSWTVTVTYELGTCTTPAAPTVNNQSLCPGSTVADLQYNGITGAIYKWYDAPTAGNLLPTSTVLANGNYYVTQTIGTCESPRSAALTVTLAPTPLPTAVPQTFCNGAMVSGLATTSGVNIKWYAAATGGTPLAPTVLLVHGDYFVTQTVSGCESARATVAITVNTTPPPVTPTVQTFCAGSNSTVANLQATAVTGATIKWYNSNTSTTQLLSTAPLGTGLYYVSQVLGVCEGVRVEVQVAVATIVPPTIDTNPMELCTGATVADLHASGSDLATFKWFATQDSTTPLTPEIPVVAGTYYVTQTISSCESGKAAVQVTLLDVAAPEVADQQLCAGSTVANLQATAIAGGTIKWYDSETSGTALLASAVLVSGTYYASQKVNDCESDRDTVVVTVNETLNAPVISNQAICTGSQLSDIPVEAVEGATLRWYANNGTATQLPPTTAAVSGTTYFVSQVLGTCESARTSVTVTFTFIEAPTTQSLTVCQGTTFAELEATGVEGASFNWYATMNDTTPLASTTVVTAGTFYLSQIVNGCESVMAPVAVSLIITAAPAPIAQQLFCGSAIVSDLNAGATETYQVNWYSPSGSLMGEGDALITGNYTVSQTANGCESQAKPVSVIVTTQPDEPVGEAEQDFTAGETVADLELEFFTGVTVSWYFLNEDAWVSIPESTPLIDGGVYGVKQSIGECESDIKSIAVNIVLSREDFELSKIKIYPNPTTDVLNLDAKDALSQIVIINLLGQRVLEKQVNANSAQISIANLPQATYILQVYGANGGTATFKIVKQ
ncbi:Ig-like domain-containing protein [Flavobacterium hauense]